MIRRDLLEPYDSFSRRHLGSSGTELEALLSTVGGVLGVATGLGVAQGLHLYVPALPVRTPFEYVFLALLMSLLVGFASGLLPARRAASVDPVVALTAE